MTLVVISGSNYLKRKVETMIKINDLTIDFEHNAPFISTKKFKMRTQCVVNYRNYTLHGESYCSVKDNFNRATGRKIALTRAISTLSKSDRSVIWEEYFKISKKY